MMNGTVFQPGMLVVTLNGSHLGTVERVVGNRLLLAEEFAGQRWLPLEWVSDVTDQVQPRVTEEQARREWETGAAQTP